MLTNRNMTAFALLACLVAVGGCSKYYQVRDPQTGRTYYSSDVNKRSGGAVTLKDAKSGAEVTVQNSEVREIDKRHYEANRGNSGRNLEAEAQAAAEAKAAEEEAAQRAAEAKAEQARAAEAKAKSAEADAKAAEAKAKSADSDAAALSAAAVGAAAVKHAESAQQLRADLVASKDQVDRSLGALKELTDPNQSDLTAAYKRFSEQVTRMNQQSQKVKAEADAMRQAREAYFAKWDARLAATENPTIRAESESKRARLRAGQEKIAADAASAREAYQPFIIALEDTRKYVGTDVSKEAVSVLAPTAKKAQQDGALLKQRIDAVIADLDVVEGKPTTRPSSPAAAQPAAAAIPGDSTATPASSSPPAQESAPTGKTSP